MSRSGGQRGRNTAECKYNWFWRAGASCQGHPFAFPIQALFVLVVFPRRLEIVILSQLVLTGLWANPVFCNCWESPEDAHVARSKLLCFFSLSLFSPPPLISKRSSSPYQQDSQKCGRLTTVSKKSFLFFFYHLPLCQSRPILWGSLPTERYQVCLFTPSLIPTLPAISLVSQSSYTEERKNFHVFFLIVSLEPFAISLNYASGKLVSPPPPFPLLEHS